MILIDGTNYPFLLWVGSKQLKLTFYRTSFFSFRPSLFFFLCFFSLPKSFFKSLDAIISSFIWAGKTPRISKSALQRPKQEGVFACHNNMSCYYWAANLQMVKKWHHSPEIIWCDMEANSCINSSLPALLFAPLPTKYSQYTNNPVVLSSLKIWNQIRQHFQFKSPSVLIPICNNHLFLPSTLDTTYTKWKEKGLVSFSDLYTEGIFSSLGGIAVTYGIENVSIFRFFQLRHFASTHFPSFPSLPGKNIVETIMAPSDSLNNISAIFSTLISTQASSLLGLRHTWERELGIELGEDWWSEALYRINSSCACARMCLIQFKVVHRIHYTRAKLSRMFPDTTDSCNRCRHSPADHTHTFFSCPKLFSFWTSFFDTLSAIFGFSVPPCPLIAIFGVSPAVGRFNRYQKDMVAFASLIARRCILLQWKSPSPPPTTSWLKDLTSFLHLEKIKFAVRGSLNGFHRTWDSFLSYINSLTTID